MTMKIFRHVTQRFLRENGRNLIRIRNVPIILSIGGASGILLALSPVAPKKDTFLLHISGLTRFLRSISIGLLISFDYTFSKMGLNESDSNYTIMIARVHQRAANRLLQGCLTNGGTYIKLGQGLASMNHILPAEYVNTLKLLQDKCLVRKQDEVELLFLEDFGKRPEELFKEFNPVPIAAASLAQVYKATTYDGEEVAVKVQYIDLQDRFNSDVATIEFILNIIGWLHKDFNFKWILEESRDSLEQELNFINEGRNGERCAADLRHLKYVYVPKIKWHICSSRVLVTEFIDGIKISDVKVLKENGFDLPDINRKLFETFGAQIFQTGFVHADPHPGNVLIRRHHNETQLVLLDHGLYQNISERDRTALSHMWKAIILQDHKKMKRYAKELGVDDYIMFAEVLTQMPLKFKKFKLTKLTEDDIKHIKEFAAIRFEAVMNVLRQMPSQLLLILRNLNTIRSITLEHGNPIDQYGVLARCATKQAFKSGHSLLWSVRTFPAKISFEISLVKNQFHIWLQRIILRMLRYLGWSIDIQF